MRGWGKERTPDIAVDSRKLNRDRDHDHHDHDRGRETVIASSAASRTA